MIQDELMTDAPLTKESEYDEIVIVTDDDRDIEVDKDVSDTQEIVGSKTLFPELFDELRTYYESDGEDEYESDDEGDEMHLFHRLQEKVYNTKEDADVAVFRKIADRLSLRSLTHLLQVQTHSTSQYEDAAIITTPCNSNKRKISSEPTKVFRWAIEEKEVHSIEAWKDMLDLWWTKEELCGIKRDLVDTIRFFTRYNRNYVDTLEVVIKGEQPKEVLENEMKKLSKDPVARGLECHMLPLVGQARKKAVQRVLQQQRICKGRGDEYGHASECLRKQSLLHSQMFAGFAERRGRCDEIEALAVNISRWG